MYTKWHCLWSIDVQKPPLHNYLSGLYILFCLRIKIHVIIWHSKDLLGFLCWSLGMFINTLILLSYLWKDILLPLLKWGEIMCLYWLMKQMDVTCHFWPMAFNCQGSNPLSFMKLFWKLILKRISISLVLKVSKKASFPADPYLMFNMRQK